MVRLLEFSNLLKSFLKELILYLIVNKIFNIYFYSIFFTTHRLLKHTWGYSFWYETMLAIQNYQKWEKFIICFWQIVNQSEIEIIDQNLFIIHC